MTSEGASVIHMTRGGSAVSGSIFLCRSTVDVVVASWTDWASQKRNC